MKKITYLLILSFNLSFGQNLTGFYPTSGANGSQFGYKVDADNNHILVSSQNNLNPTSNIGKVYLFENTLIGIIQTNTFYPADALSTDEFGSAISIKNDFIAVGSPKNDELAENAGAVYIYKKTNNVWDFSQKITAFDYEANDIFGIDVKLINDYMFVSTSSNSGAIYVYYFDGSVWSFSQKILPVENSLSLGKIFTDGNSLLVEEYDGISITLKKYQLNGTNWEIQNQLTFGEFGFTINDFCFKNNKIYVLVNLWDSGCNVSEFSEINNQWQTTNTIPINYNDQIYTTIEVQNDKMFLGSTNYELQVTRKFPVMYFKKIANNWNFQNVIYGNGPSGEDDYFGESITTTNDLLVIGAPTEGITQSGKAYITPLSTLGLNKSENLKVVAYPNPTKNKLFFQNDGINAIQKIEIYSITGKLLLEKQTEFETISLENFSNGIYFARLIFGDSTSATFKVVKN